MTPDQEEQVRRALGAVARNEPVPPLPPDVAARLDAVLDDLVTAPAPTTSLRQAGEQRSRWPRVLLAAAAVAVIALGGGAVALRELGGTDGSATSSGPAAGGAARREASGSASAAVVPKLSSDTLARDVQRVVDEPAGGTPQRALSQPGAEATRSPGAAASRPAPSLGAVRPAPGCAAPMVRPRERLVAVRLDGRPAWLAVPVRAGTRVARVYPCGAAATPVASATVHVP